MAGCGRLLHVGGTSLVAEDGEPPLSYIICR
jgi:hypothetical protein